MNAFRTIMSMLVLAAAILSLTESAAGNVASIGRGKSAVTIENRHVRFTIGVDGKNLSFVDKRTGRDYLAPGADNVFAQVKKDGKYESVTAVSHANDLLSLKFGDAGVRAVIEVVSHDEYFTFKVKSVSGDPEELVFGVIHLLPPADARDAFGGCALALNLQTNVWEMPGQNEWLRAVCYSRLGLEGSEVAIVAAPRGEMRRIMQDVVMDAPELPKSDIGGPWSLDPEINRGSYLFNFNDLTEQTVDEWIARARKYGINQIDFHGGTSFRFGDCRPNPQLYPNGRASLKAVIDKLHAAGIKAGLHPYAFFMAKDCPWVTPVPHPGLGKDATFTLAEPLSAAATSVPVLESTKDMSTITGFFERNSVTLQIDDELIIYSGIDKEEPYAFTECRRGAHGTKVTAHDKGAKVYHLKECFGLFAPDGESELLAEVAAAVADTYNECGFDMIYLDALDGAGVLGKYPADYWHYSSKFVFEIAKRLKRPALMEMSLFHHHLWYVRSRMGAWDSPSRSQKEYIDVHCALNKAAERMFMPAHLGWWAVHVSEGPDAIQQERTYPDEIEYLMCKCIGNDTGFSLLSTGPDTPGYTRLAPIFRQYEELRHADYFPESVKEKLRAPGDEFTLEQASDGKWQLRRADYARHKVTSPDGKVAWEMKNKFGRQPVRLRIEALMSAAPYDSPDGVVIADFANPDEFADRESREGVTLDLTASKEQVKAGDVSGCYTALSTRGESNGSWTKVSKTFAPVLNISEKRALGVWVYGDGSGAVLNIRPRSPEHIDRGLSDRFVKLDFTGWRYFELIEPEGARTDDYAWPYNNYQQKGQATDYGHVYGVYREGVNYANVETLSLWYNDLPKGREVKTFISPVKALPIVKNKLRNPKLRVGGKEIVFPVEIESGSWLEFNSMDDCTVYAPNGEIVAKVKPEGEIPVLEPGSNRVEFECEIPDGTTARAWVTVMTRGGVID